jgi:UMF1 family MFS transporter
MARRRAAFSWVLYVWADHAFATIVATFVFATYFTQAVAENPIKGASQWVAMQTVAGAAVALLAVPLGAIADSGGRRNALLALSLFTMIAATAALWFVKPDPSYVLLALVLAGIGTVAYEVATIFYNAMLPDLAPKERFGRLSSFAWGAGYGGGLAALVVALVLLVQPDPPLFGLDAALAEPVRACALLAALWALAFGWPALVFIPRPATQRPWGEAVRTAWAELRTTLRAAVADPVLRRFLIARMLFMDGLVTLFAFGGIFAAGTFGFTPRDVLLFGIGLNITAGLGVLGFAFIEDRIGPKAAIIISLWGLVILGAPALVVTEPLWFWVFGLALGLFVGPAQSASRSLMAHMAPPEARSAWFGLFALSGRVTAFVGPLFLALATNIFQSQRAGMATILVFLAAGALALIGLRVPRR